MDNYEDIYERMKADYEQKSGCELDNSSDVALRLRVLAGEVFGLQTNLEWLKRQMFLTTASGESLDYLASQRRIKRREARKAKGELTFYISEPTDHEIVVPQGCVVATIEAVPQRFITTETDTIPPGGTLISVSAVAEQAGRSGNAKKGAVVSAVRVPSEIVGVQNQVAFKGGTDTESDDELRERILQSYISLANGSNKAFYEEIALGVEGVEKAYAIPKMRGVGSVNVFVSGDGEVVGSDTLSEVQRRLNEKSEIVTDVVASNVEFAEYNLTVTVYAKAGHSAAEIKYACKKAFTDYVKTIDIGGKLYLTALGQSLMDTGLISNYELHSSMQDKSLSQSQCFIPGEVNITVE